MSTFKVEIVEIRDVKVHPNAHSLEICEVFGWNVVTQKGRFQTGHLAVYIPVDSLLPWDLEQKLFPPESKVKLHKSRIKSIKLRGQVSQGMLIGLDEVDLFDSTLGEDVTETLKITKYEPPAIELPDHMQAKKKWAVNNNFKKYTDIENFKYYDRNFQDGEMVYISEKLHGTSFRAGWFKNEPNSLWKKVLNFFRMLPEYEFCWGSKNVQIQCKFYHAGYYDIDVYSKIVKQYDLKNCIPKGYAIYGEIVGDGIQKGYTYGCKAGEHKLYVYDIMKDEKYLSYYTEGTTFAGPYEGPADDAFTLHGPEECFQVMVNQFGLEPVPFLYGGPFDRKIVDGLRDGDSLVGGQKVREGIVIKPVIEQQSSFGRKVLKYISEAYYMVQDGTDFH